MAKIAFLGIGAMGSRMATRLSDAGHRLTIWNRTRAATHSLASLGITIAKTPRQAVRDADFVMSMVRDDEASEYVWLDAQDGALWGMDRHAIGIECATVSPDHGRKLVDAFREADRAFVDAPLAGSRPQAEAGQLIFLVGGAAKDVQRIEPVLMDMGSQVHHLGRTGLGFAMKLVVNGYFGIQLAALAELLSLAEKMELTRETAVNVLGATPLLSRAAETAAKAMLSGAFAPAFPLELVEKDFSLLVDQADDHHPLPLSNAVQRLCQEALEKGIGNLNITAFAKLFPGPGQAS